MRDGKERNVQVKHRSPRIFRQNIADENRQKPNMTELQATKTDFSSNARPVGLVRLELSGDRIHTMNVDGSTQKTIVTDSISPTACVERSRPYVLDQHGLPNLATVRSRADLDGGNRRVIIPQGITHTPKQIHLDKDRANSIVRPRGMRVMRGNLDGSQSKRWSRRPGTRTVTIRPWCVGIPSIRSLGKSTGRRKSDEGGLAVCAAHIDLPKGRGRESL